MAAIPVVTITRAKANSPTNLLRTSFTSWPNDELSDARRQLVMQNSSAHRAFARATCWVHPASQIADPYNTVIDPKWRSCSKAE